jgi:hypothetical protein
MAVIAYDFFNGVIETKKNTLYQSLKSLARDSRHDVTNYASIVSAINALEDLQKDLQNKIKNARSVEGEMINGN